jgi:rod shape determining protein RodA
MNYGDYARRMPGAGDLQRRTPLLARIRIDGPLLALLLILTTIGLVVLYSASGQHNEAVERQGIIFGLAYTAMFTIAQIDLKRLRRLAPWGYLGGVVLLLAVTFFGTQAKGAQRWLNLGGFQFQPSEVMKIAMPMAVAWYLSARALPPGFKHVLGALAIIAVPTLLIAEQPDLGTSLLVAASGTFVLFLAGLRWGYILTGAVAALAALWPLWHFGMHDYQRRRVLTLLNPEADKLGAGWNIIQSKTAIGSGGWSGKGWLDGTQSHLDFLPEGHTDFIIAVLAEEWGLRGVLVLLGIYTLLLARGLWIALRAPTAFGRLLGGALVLTFFVYVFVNMGMVSGLLPVVGVPLPLISQGGTALVTLFAGFGLLMAIAADKRPFMR